MAGGEGAGKDRAGGVTVRPYKLGQAASTDDLAWFGSLLGWTWPPSYLEVLGRHNGVWVKQAIIFSFLESIDVFLLYRSEWHRHDGYWPVATDECGNYFSFSIGDRNGQGEYPVVFLEYGTQNCGTVGRTYAEFVVNHLADECRHLGCTSPIQKTASRPSV
jgi:hypothetical protein